MKLLFSVCKKTGDFFNILPPDWQEGIEPYWQSYKDTATIYTINIKGSVVAGGIVFSKLPPNPSELDKKYDTLFEKGYLYIGFLFVIPKMRLHHLGSKWLTFLKNLNPYQCYWLTIEEESLKDFYQKNGFAILDESKKEHKECVLLYKNKKEAI